MTRNPRRRRITPSAFYAALCFVLFEALFWFCADTIMTSGISVVRITGILLSIVCFALFIEFTAETVHATVQKAKQ